MTAIGVRILENVPVMVRQTVQESLFGQCRCMILMFIIDLEARNFGSELGFFEFKNFLICISDSSCILPCGQL